MKRVRLRINAQALGKLANHDWPGNVRELQHAIEKAVIMCDAPVLKPSDFMFNAPSRENRIRQHDPGRDGKDSHNRDYETI